MRQEKPSSPEFQSTLSVTLPKKVGEAYDVLHEGTDWSYTELTRQAMIFYLPAIEAKAGNGGLVAVRNVVDRLPLEWPQVHAEEDTDSVILTINISREYEDALHMIGMLEGRSDDQIVGEAILFLKTIMVAFGDGYEKVIEECEGQELRTIIDLSNLEP